jgi:hypothetical protein
VQEDRGEKCREERMREQVGEKLKLMMKRKRISSADRLQ